MTLPYKNSVLQKMAKYNFSVQCFSRRNAIVQDSVTMIADLSPLHLDQVAVLELISEHQRLDRSRSQWVAGGKCLVAREYKQQCQTSLCECLSLG